MAWNQTLQQMPTFEAGGLQRLQQMSQQKETPWAALQRSQLAAQQSEAGERLGRDSQAQLGTNINRMAMMGGIRSGAAERMSNQAALGQNRAMAGLAREGLQQGTNIGIDSAKTQYNLATQIPQLELQKYQTDMGAWKTMQEIEAARQQAEIMAAQQAQMQRDASKSWLNRLTGGLF